MARKLNKYSLSIYKNTYFLPKENYSLWVDRMTMDRVSDTATIDVFEKDIERMSRIKEYIQNQWFHPATPISSNLGTNRGLPISCFVREVEDSKDGIFYTYNEGFHLGAEGTGIGTDWSSVRSVGEPINEGIIGTSSGVIPFIGVSDRAALAISQGGTRRSAEAVFLRIDHPEIEEFIELKKPNREINRFYSNIHYGVIITDKFMKAVQNRSTFNLKSPKTGKTLKTVDAFTLFTRILDMRTRFQGEPYLFFIDNANKNKAELYKERNQEIHMTNLCTEINLRTDKDTANVCCLGSLNLKYYDEYKDNINEVVGDLLWYLDNVLSCFIYKLENDEKYKNNIAYKRALKGAKEDRPLGLGVMGFHDYLQSKFVPFTSISAIAINDTIFKSIKTACDEYDKTSKHVNATHVAIAPTTSISTLCNFTSSGIEPIFSNYYSKKIKQGTFLIKNEILEKYIENYYSKNIDKTVDKKGWIELQWENIKKNGGSVSNLDWMPDEDKEVFLTAMEINQFSIINLASRRQKYIDQGQSVNLFFKSGESVKYIYDVHVFAWKNGLNSLYYQRSLALQRMETSNTRQVINTECGVCQ